MQRGATPASSARLGAAFALVAALLLARCGGGAGGDLADLSGSDRPDAGMDVPAADLPGDDLAAADRPDSDAPMPDALVDVPPADNLADLPDVPEGTPILARPPDPRFDCSIARDVTKASPLQWLRFAHPLVVTPGCTAFLARAEASPSNPYAPAPNHLLESTFDVAGTLGAATEVPATADAISGIAVAPASDGFLMAWFDGVMQTVRVGEDGAVKGAVHAFPDLSGDTLTRPSLAASGAGFGMAWRGSDTRGGATVRFVRLDANGVGVGTTVTLANVGSDPAPQVAWSGGRWGILWQWTEGDRAHLGFAAVEADGTVSVPARTIWSSAEVGTSTSAAGFSQDRLALMGAGTGWVGAFCESRSGADYTSGASAIVRVARLGADGTVLDQAPVRPIQVDRDEVEPVLVPFGNAAALFWSSGDHIYICAGCVPDHRIDMVLLDPVSLRPLSDVVSAHAPDNGTGSPQGGLLDLSAAALGDDLLVTLQIRYHVSAESASLALQCAAR